jgi:2-polyprenyl-3-methyl-5-hydroxy-6-metoxy-1,4-benzoquinol methylase
VALSARQDGCPVCGSAERSPVVEQNRLQVVRCPRCAQRYVWPVPSAAVLQAIYDGAYYRGGHGSVGFSDYGSLARARRRMFGHHLDRLRPFLSGGRVLDVGCATGDFLLVARDRGWEVLGVDPSPAADQARAAGLRICGGTIRDAEIEAGSLDLITFWDVLEHVPDPVGELRLAAGLLRQDGLVALTVPDAGGLTARLSGKRWFGYKTAGEHLQFFTAATLRRTLAAAGFQLLLRRPVAWSCTVGFLVDRAALYLGPPGRLLNRGLARTPMAGLIVDVPQVNQFAVARRRPAASRRTASAA